MEKKTLMNARKDYTKKSCTPPPQKKKKEKESMP